MKRNISSAQIDVRLIHLTINGDTLAFGGEDQRLVEKVEKVGDVVTVTLKGHARPKGGRPIGVIGLYEAGAASQAYKHLSSSVSVINLETLDTGVHGMFGLTLIANDSRHLYDR